MKFTVTPNNPLLTRKDLEPLTIFKYNGSSDIFVAIKDAVSDVPADLSPRNGLIGRVFPHYENQSVTILGTLKFEN